MRNAHVLQRYTSSDFNDERGKTIWYRKMHLHSEFLSILEDNAWKKWEGGLMI